MDLAAVEQAAKVIPVFVRNDDKEPDPIRLEAACYKCEHGRPLSARSSYFTLVAYAGDEHGNFNDPLFGVTVSMNDSSYRDLTRYHWIRYLISGATGVYGGWTSRANIEEYPIMFVRLFNGFDGQGVQHKHARVNLFEYVEHLHQADEVFVEIFEPHTGRPGLYVDPVEELREANDWKVDEINEFVHVASRDVGIQQRMVGYYWRNFKHDRLKQLKAGDTLPDIEPVGTRQDAINAVVREAERAQRARLREAALRGFDERNNNAAMEQNGTIRFNVEPRQAARQAALNEWDVEPPY